MTDLDLSALDDVAPSNEKLAEIAELARRQVAAELEVKEAEEALQKAKNNLTRIRENLLPDAMREVGMEKFTTDDGTQVDVKEAVFASISEANRLPAHNWLRTHGHGAIIKNTVTASFNPGEDDKAQKVREYLESEGLDCSSKSAIHNGTLRSWVNNQLAEGNPIPDAISYYEQRISKVKVR